MKIGFVTDTNILKNVNMYEENSIINGMNIFWDYIKSLNKASKNLELIYYMPSIILEELLYQKNDDFNNKYEKFIKLYRELSYGLECNKPNNIIKTIIQKEKKEIVDRCKIINLVYKQEIFEELVEDALAKNPPFDKSSNGKKTDSGYKDALIYKTLLYNKEIEKCDKIYFFSGDKIFESNIVKLQDAFHQHHSSTELIIKYIEPNGSQRQNCLEILINENQLIKTDVIKLYDTDLILKIFKRLKFSYPKMVYYYDDDVEDNRIVLRNVIFEKFDKNDFVIVDVKKKTKEYEVITHIKTKKYVLNKENNEKELLGKITFKFNENGQELEMTSYDITDLKFGFNILKNLMEYIEKALDFKMSNYLEEIMNDENSDFYNKKEN